MVNLSEVTQEQLPELLVGNHVEQCRPIIEVIQNHTSAARRWIKLLTFPKVLQEQLAELPVGIHVKNAAPL